MECSAKDGPAIVTCIICPMLTFSLSLISSEKFEPIAQLFHIANDDREFGQCIKVRAHKWQIGGRIGGFHA